MLRSSPLVVAFVLGCSSTTTAANPSHDAASDALADAATPTDTSVDEPETSVDSEPIDSGVADTTEIDSGSIDTGGETDPFGGGCNTIEQKGAPVMQTAWTDPIPTFVGGIIADGTWVMTKWGKTEGAAPSSMTTAETIVVSGSSWQIAAEAGSFFVRANGSASTSGNTVTFTQSCPMSGSAKATLYTATATQLVVRDAASHDLTIFTKM